MARNIKRLVGEVDLQIPAFGWKPRPYQMAAWNAAIRDGIRRHCLIWHRRAGKDEFALHRTAHAMMKRPATYWHMLPQANQARKAIWNAVDESEDPAKRGKRRIDLAFPEALRKRYSDHEMFIEFNNGATWQVVGSDNYNSLVGSPPVGIVFSEFSRANPAAWDFLRPILTNNGGWAMFITTPYGENHTADQYRFAVSDPAWFAQLLTVEDTGAISLEAVDDERRELAAVRGDTEAKSIIDQEYYCSFSASLPGAYYAEILTRMEKAERIGVFPWDPRYPVRWGSDLGMHDASTFWFWQDINGAPRIINYFDVTGVEEVSWIVNRINSLPYTFGRGLLPHDGGHTRLGMAGSIAAQMTRLGLKNDVVPVTKDITAAINQTKTFLTTCTINTDPDPFPDETAEQARARMKRALSALRMYHREYDPETKRFNDKPEHDWTSDVADGLRTLACGYRPSRTAGMPLGPGGVMSRQGTGRPVRIADGAGE